MTRRFPNGVRAEGAARARSRIAGDRRTRLCAVLPHRPRHRPLRPHTAGTDPVPGPRLGGEFHHLLLPRHHRGQPRHRRSAVRALRVGERREPPDIDVDFEHERREEVIQHIYAKYGREHAGLAATVICYRGRSAVREVGKAFGLSEDTVSALASTLWGWSMDGIAEKEARRAGLDPSDPRLQMTLSADAGIAGLPAPSVAACRRLRHHPHPARRSGAGRECGDGGPHRHRMGQGRSRCARPAQGRCAGAGHAELPAPRLRFPARTLRCGARSLDAGRGRSRPTG